MVSFENSIISCGVLWCLMVSMWCFMMSRGVHIVLWCFMVSRGVHIVLWCLVVSIMSCGVLWCLVVSIMSCGVLLASSPGPARIVFWHWLGSGSTETICQNLCIESVHPMNTEDSILQHRLFNSLLLHLACILHDSQLISTVAVRHMRVLP